MPLRTRWLVLILLMLTACSTAPVQRKPSTRPSPAPAPVRVEPAPPAESGAERRPGGYLAGDGPPAQAPDITSIPEPVPVDEAELPRANQPYVVEGETVVPERGKRAYSERGVASWYGKRFHGRRTASGERYDMYAFSAAHRTLPIPSYARVTNLANGRSVVVRVNDRGPFHRKRLIDLSWAAAEKLGFTSNGQAQVLIERVLPGEAAAPPRDTSPPQAPAVAVQETVDPARGWLQAGSFRKEKSARALLDRVQRSAGNVPGVQLVLNGGFYRVLLGPYADEAAARAAIADMRDVLGQAPVVYRVPQVVASEP